MKIGIAQINTTVGDLSGNLKIALESYHSLVGKGAELIVFPELTLCGYPPRDLLLRKYFVQECTNSLIEFAAATGSCPALVGYPEINHSQKGKPFFNSAGLCWNGEVKQVFRKRLLPTYDVFDEDRYFECGASKLYFSHLDQKIGVSICEDLWDSHAKLYSQDPVKELLDNKIDLVINLSASPWHLDKKQTRISTLKDAVGRLNCPLVYANSVGGNDELIFDGSSLVLNPKGEIIHSCSKFRTSCEVFDLNMGSPSQPLPQDDLESIEEALVLGLHDYVRKSGFTQCLLGLSGGIDSALTAALAVKAVGRKNVIGISMPSAISSDHSVSDAKELAENLGIEYHSLSIQNIVDSIDSKLAPLFAGLQPDVTEENIQARARGLLLMAVSNKFGSLLLTTGNKSELAVGYCTLYGDMCGGLAVISDLPKTKVFELARHINMKKELIPVHTIEKPPSAELRPDQKDTDSLPDYEVLDAILHGYIEKGMSIKCLLGEGFEEETVRKIISLVDRNEYKRKQAAPGLKITPLAFGMGRRIPIVQKYLN